MRHDDREWLMKYGHTETTCTGKFCVIHRPSHHLMYDWPMTLRETALVERRCEHGVGHPDPDSATYFEQYFVRLGAPQHNAWFVHGCDGCCNGAYVTGYNTPDENGVL